MPHLYLVRHAKAGERRLWNGSDLDRPLSKKGWKQSDLVGKRLVKTGGRLVKHARYYWLLLAESHLTRRLFGDRLQRIWALPVPDG